MRIDLEHSQRRPWFLRIAMGVVRRLAGGIVPGPMLLMSHRPDFMSPALRGYVLRAMRASPAWTKGQAELMAAFVSNLNRCHF